MNKETRGYLLIAIEHKKYLEYSVDLCLSIMEYNDEPVSIIVDDNLKKYCIEEYGDLFDEIITMPEKYRSSVQ